MKKFGISVALLTPFTDSGTIDTLCLGRHAASVLAEGANGVTLFGTTGENASIGAEERANGIEALQNAGCQPSQIVLGLCACSLADALNQIAEGVRYGITAFLLPPPFYFKGNSDAGLFDWHMALFARADPKAQFILYHIPQVTGVPLSINLVGQLAAAAPHRILAIKDSSGSWENGMSLIEQGALQVLIGDERVLHRAVAKGAGGAITGMANLHPARMARIVETATEDQALTDEVNRIVSRPVIPALKAILFARTGDAGWARLRAPLKPLSDSERQGLFLDKR